MTKPRTELYYQTDNRDVYTTELDILDTEGQETNFYMTVSPWDLLFNALENAGMTQEEWDAMLAYLEVQYRALAYDCETEIGVTPIARGLAYLMNGINPETRAEMPQPPDPDINYYEVEY